MHIFSDDSIKKLIHFCHFCIPLQSTAASTPGLKYLTSEAEMLSEDSQSPSAFSRHRNERMKRRSTSMSAASEERGRGRRPHRLLTTRERNASRKKLGFAIEVSKHGVIKQSVGCHMDYSLDLRICPANRSEMR